MVCAQLNGTVYNSYDALPANSGFDANIGSIVSGASPGDLVPQNASINGIQCGLVASAWYGS